jgi:RimJ/RimL family protein N-acetyltransferase
MIYGKRIRLRMPEREDIPRWMEWINDPEVTAGLMVSLPMAWTDEEKFFEDNARRPQAERVMAIDIQDGEGWRHIGNCGVHNIDWRVRSAELGIMIGDKSAWNQGFGTETMRLLLRHGFETLNLNRIALDVYDTNPRAIRSYEKAGFVLEGRKRQAMFKNGHYIDVLVMSVLRAEWKP